MTDCLLGCSSDSISQQELNRITDGLQQCLSCEVGLREFDKFLNYNQFDEVHTLHVWQKTLDLLIKHSERSRRSLDVEELEHDYQDLYERADRMEVNLDQGQMEEIGAAPERGVSEILRVTRNVKKWAEAVLDEKYKLFRKEKLIERQRMLVQQQKCASKKRTR